jgi:hypothetical protein
MPDAAIMGESDATIGAAARDTLNREHAGNSREATGRRIGQ